MTEQLTHTHNPLFKEHTVGLLFQGPHFGEWCSKAEQIKGNDNGVICLLFLLLHDIHLVTWHLSSWTQMKGILLRHLRHGLGFWHSCMDGTIPKVHGAENSGYSWKQGCWVLCKPSGCVSFSQALDPSLCGTRRTCFSQHFLPCFPPPPLVQPRTHGAPVCFVLEKKQVIKQEAPDPPIWMRPSPSSVDRLPLQNSQAWKRQLKPKSCHQQTSVGRLLPAIVYLPLPGLFRDWACWEGLGPWLHLSIRFHHLSVLWQLPRLSGLWSRHSRGERQRVDTLESLSIWEGWTHQNRRHCRAHKLPHQPAAPATSSWMYSVIIQLNTPVGCPRPLLSPLTKSNPFSLSWPFSPFLIFFLFFSLIFVSHWNIVDLHSCVSFRCTAKWLSYAYTYVHSFSDSFTI